MADEDQGTDQDDAPRYKPRDAAGDHYWEPEEQRADVVSDDVEEAASSDAAQHQVERRMRERVEGGRPDEEGPAARGSSIEDE